MLQNLHTHTLFSDGKNSAEEMVRAAIAAGLTSLGFSEHSPFPWGTEGWATPAERIGDYRAEILRLRRKYAGQLEILLGLEQDLDSHPLPGPWDYLIGSVHLVWAEGVHRSVDHRLECTEQTIRQFFGGDPYAYTAAYFRRLAQVAERTGCRIIGHFDLVTKFNEGGILFDENHPRYLSAALEALDALAERDVVFEINTGAMSRGCRTAPYPAPHLLRAMRERGCPICINSDSHSTSTLTHAFDRAAELARSCGFRSVHILTPQGFVESPL